MSAGINNTDVVARVEKLAEVTGLELAVEWEQNAHTQMARIVQNVGAETVTFLDPMPRRMLMAWLEAYERGFRAGKERGTS